MKIAFNPAFLSDSKSMFCFPKIFNGVTMICTLPFGQESNGIQNIEFSPSQFQLLRQYLSLPWEWPWQSWSAKDMADSQRWSWCSSVFQIVKESNEWPYSDWEWKKKSKDGKLYFIPIKLSIGSLPSLVTVAELVDKHFVPGPTEQLKKIELLSLGRYLKKFWTDVSEMWVLITTGLQLSQQYIYALYLDFHVVKTWV